MYLIFLKVINRLLGFIFDGICFYFLKYVIKGNYIIFLRVLLLDFGFVFIIL